jgi:predicted tellurium resistance membrane protein TerC
MSGILVFDVVAYILFSIIGIIVAYNSFSFMEKSVNRWVVICVFGVLSLISILLLLVDSPIFSRFIFYPSVALATYGLLSCYLVVQKIEEEEEQERDEIPGDTLEYRIKAMKEKNKR